MSLIDKIKARPENGGPAKVDLPKVEQAEIDVLKAELDAEIQASKETASEDESLTPEQIEARTKESYEDEIKKLREENAKRRKKEQEAKEKALAMAEEVFKSEREEYEKKLAELKKKLEEKENLKKEESKVDEEIKQVQSSVENEKLLKELEELRRETAAIKAEAKARLEAEEQEKALRRQAAENRFNTMLKEVPEEYKDFAIAMFNGYKDPSEGLIALTRAKAQGMFGKKTIEVVSRIPKDEKDNKTTELSPRQVRNRRVNAIKERRQGLRAGDRLL